MNNNSKIMRRTISLLLLFTLWISLSAANKYILSSNDNANLNNQIKIELQVSSFYLAASHYFERSDLALLGVSKLFDKMSSEGNDHAQKLMTYMNTRLIPPKTPDVSVHKICDYFLNENICKTIENCPERVNCTNMASKTYDKFCSRKCHPPICDELTEESPFTICGSITGNISGANAAKKEGMLLNVMILAGELENMVFKALNNIIRTTKDYELKHFIAHDYLEEQVKFIKQIFDYKTQLKKMGSGLGTHIFDKRFL